MRPTRTSVRTGAIAVTVGMLATGSVLIAPAAPAAPTAATPVSATAPAAPTAATPVSATAPAAKWGASSADPFAVSAAGPQGGDPIYSSNGSRCTIGFNVRNSSNVHHFLLSGHCGSVGTNWYTDLTRTRLLGTTVASSFPGNDYAIARYATGITPLGAVNLHNGASQDITSAANAFVGEAVKSSSSVTGLRSGTVTAVNATVNYAQGAVTGLIKTNVCVEGGDSGGPLFDGGKALGLASGGSGNCSSGGTSYYQPVTEPLAVYGVTVF